MKAMVGGLRADEGRDKSALVEARTRKTSSHATAPMQSTQDQPTDSPKPLMATHAFVSHLLSVCASDQGCIGRQPRSLT
jgi:hypothetical protein